MHYLLEYLSESNLHRVVLLCRTVSRVEISVYQLAESTIRFGIAKACKLLISEGIWPKGVNKIALELLPSGTYGCQHLRLNQLFREHRKKLW